MFYVMKDGPGTLTPETQNGILSSVSGNTPELGSFKISFYDGQKNLLSTYLSTHLDKVHDAKDVVMKNLHQFKLGNKGKMQLLGLPGRRMSGEVENKDENFVVFSGVFELPFTVEIAFESGSVKDRQMNALKGSVFQENLMKYSDFFEKKFEQKFQLRKKGYSTDEILFAQATLGNAIGGIGYFHGTSLVISDLVKAPVDYWESSLYTGVPSRSFFPRGFLWDEGFHQLLISQWDSTISADVIGYWLDLMNIEGN
jgi:mannosyl-oligosaccharide glucosidase